MFFFIILGLLSITAVVFLMSKYIKILKNGKCVMGKISEIDNGTSYALGGTSCFIEVQFYEDGHDIKLITLNHFFLPPFFYKRKLSRLKKHIGRQVHIYYNPDNKTQVLLREYIWKEFFLCFFMFSWGIILILMGICKWY